ncbi:polyadenylate-binding protein-interacting protein 2B [Cylas formicarius]|uniref:polyadenylate-binding protein-interacting protein 2B n=1 Tax=Cylas formicarius TaxID=197179 RepID=UPI002958D449|nr:polyadenylate-binding protein-interacting protein 2B [Cylas formicarius]
MKMPPTDNKSTDNGIYDFEETSLSITADEIETTAVEEFETTAENDFSEYMWMENEEEFDKEVMQRLEEEELMEECMEAFMSEENSAPTATQSALTVSESVQNSKLNPEAAEFVPLRRNETLVPDTQGSTNES